MILLHVLSSLKISSSPSEVTMIAAAGLQENAEGLLGTNLPPTQLTTAAMLGLYPGSHSRWHSSAGQKFDDITINLKKI